VTIGGAIPRWEHSTGHYPPVPENRKPSPRQPADCRAVLQCAASRYGLRRSGASYYETRYRSGLSKSTSRARPSDSFFKQQRCRPPSRPFLRKVAALLGPQRRATAGLMTPWRLWRGQRLDRRRLHSAGASRASLHRRQAFRRQPLATVRPRPTPMRRLSRKSAKSYSTC